jgi:hypothetical protein
VIGGCIGLCGFAVALLAGLSAGNALDVILSRALVALAGCVVLGLVVGLLGERAVRQHIAESRAASQPRPVSTVEPVAAAPGASAEVAAAAAEAESVSRGS